MISIGVIAHKKKILGGGLEELRERLASRGYHDPLWFEASSSREAAKLAKSAAAQGAQLLLIWGGDGTVQRCVHAVIDADVEIALLPAGTANLFANNLGIPIDLKGALDVAFDGDSRRLDVGVMNGKCFTVMAGVGFDAVVMQKVDGKLKKRFGRLAYVLTAIKAMRVNAREAKIRVDGAPWFEGRATGVLFGQMNSLAGGISVFPAGLPDDGVLEIGVVTAENVRQWTRVIARLVTGSAHRSPFTRMTQGRHFEVTLNEHTPYELDGGARAPRRKHTVMVRPSAISVRVARDEAPSA
ncbi:MAG: YegS/Rv2252/BmrU family lipid kinase [Acidobacteriota bacterium]|nr:YegS/Rv2252/BmrU family lipid kinase [Acidobacteriota bacterium]MDE3043577.1 YegS/Rv2252/BmrU family lipid kinase [Acidobacteriota bacterium]MDE3107364.1 YegS/Rv2252/BmrU family lipid kinase [Acidobacteriota bacterium]MDE3222583.1 YegS/Rv2252/BmrU family lipid kinase [Acidobacteriota bacterium]